MVFEGKVGCEIECLSDSSNRTMLRRFAQENNWRVNDDGSIGGERFNESTFEFNSKPYNTSETKDFVKHAEDILKLVRVNKTCGLHFHISFADLENYYKLASWDFIQYFQEKIKQLFKSKEEVRRLSNHYCKLYTSENDFKTTTNNQIADTHKSSYRYKAINFNAYNLIGTIEFRIFAATSKPRKFKKYLIFLLKTINDYIKNNSFKEISIKLEGPTQTKGRNKPTIIREIISKTKEN